jgi:hypothetical protein
VGGGLLRSRPEEEEEEPTAPETSTESREFKCLDPKFSEAERQMSMILVMTLSPPNEMSLDETSHRRHEEEDEECWWEESDVPGLGPVPAEEEEGVGEADVEERAMLETSVNDFQYFEDFKYKEQVAYRDFRGGSCCSLSAEKIPVVAEVVWSCGKSSIRDCVWR